MTAGATGPTPHVRGLARLASLAALVLVSCSEDSPSTLEPHGPAAERIEGLWWPMLWISTAVFVVVVVMLALAWVRSYRANVKTSDHVSWGEPFIAISGVILPALILGGVFLLSLREMSALSAPEKDTEMTIEVIGNDWWWEAWYESETGSSVTANEIHIPVGTPVRLRLRTDDVIHSFWVPELQAKTDMIPGRVNEMWLQADEPGTYRGQCAEFCGLQHAQMVFHVVADPPERFDQWLAGISQPAGTPETSSAATGEDVFMSSSCAGCHAIQGTEADARLGPDLTHVANRKYLAAGILENNRDNLSLWITDPQEVKPGAAMPPTQLSSDELSALLDYLEQLD
jgi:cytochrome c oxidase subunit II